MLKAKFGTKSTWKWEQWRKNQHGKYVLYDGWVETNITTDEGVTHALDAVFSGGEQKSEWYTAIFSGEYTPLAADTYQSPGYTEITDYDEGARPTWQEAGVAAKSLTNASNRASFTMNATKTVGGGALVSASTKGDAVSGEILYCASEFSVPKNVENEDVLKVTVVIAGQDV